MDCPKCRNHRNYVHECEGVCGTLQCDDCHFEWHFDEALAPQQGHNPVCGSEEEEEEAPLPTPALDSLFTVFAADDDDEDRGPQPMEMSSDDEEE